MVAEKLPSSEEFFATGGDRLPWWRVGGGVRRKVRTCGPRGRLSSRTTLKPKISSDCLARTSAPRWLRDRGSGDRARTVCHDLCGLTQNIGTPPLSHVCGALSSGPVIGEPCEASGGGRGSVRKPLRHVSVGELTAKQPHADAQGRRVRPDRAEPEIPSHGGAQGERREGGSGCRRVDPPSRCGARAPGCLRCWNDGATSSGLALTRPPHGPRQARDQAQGHPRLRPQGDGLAARPEARRLQRRLPAYHGRPRRRIQDVQVTSRPSPLCNGVTGGAVPSEVLAAWSVEEIGQPSSS